MEVKQKKGISLIVLVITIIVMIILAAAIILSLNSSGIMGKANKAKEDTDISTIREVASMAASEYELEKVDGTTTKTKKEYVEDYLNNQNLELPEGYVVSEEGQVINNSEVVAPVSVWDGTVATSFASGTGTEADPYIIETASELAYLAAHPNIGSYYKLTSNIDLNNLQWTPIGNGPYEAFQGHFDGGNKKILNINVTLNTDFAGLFGFIVFSTVENVIIESGSITGVNYVGGIAGVVESSGILQNCTNKASINGTSKVGGVAGLGRGTITNCTNYGMINGVVDTECIIGSAS